MKKFMKLGGLFLASALSVGMVALPAGAAVKANAGTWHNVRTPSFASEIAALQGRRVTLADGATCTVSATSCTVVSTGASSLIDGTVLPIASTSWVEAHMPVGEAAGLTIGITGAVASIGDFLFFTLVIFAI